jgi:hypothetical protein
LLSRLVWTNEEGGDSGQVTTVTFEERDGKTLLVMHDLYPSKEALDGAIASGNTAGGMDEQFEQLDELLAALGTSVWYRRSLAGTFPTVREEPSRGLPFPRVRLAQTLRLRRRRTTPPLRWRTRWDPAR